MAGAVALGAAVPGVGGEHELPRYGARHGVSLPCRASVGPSEKRVYLCREVRIAGASGVHALPLRSGVALFVV